jgi:hypothetical protein
MRYMRGSHGVFNDKERGGAGKLVLALLSAVRKDVFSDLLLPAILLSYCYVLSLSGILLAASWIFFIHR